MQMCNLVEMQMDWNRAKSPDEKHKNIAIVANEDDFIWWQTNWFDLSNFPTIKLDRKRIHFIV